MTHWPHLTPKVTEHMAMPSASRGGRKSFHILNCLCNATESKTPKVLATRLEGTTYTYTRVYHGPWRGKWNPLYHIHTGWRTCISKHSMTLLSFPPSFPSGWSWIIHLCITLPTWKLRVASTQRDVLRTAKVLISVWRATSIERTCQWLVQRNF